MKRILVIDDDRDMRDFLHHVLTKAGYEVLLAENGKTGMEIFHSHLVDVVITDILMPEKDGIEVLLELENNGSIGVIAMSSGGRGLEAEFNLRVAKEIFLWNREKPFIALTKPFRPKELLKSIDLVLSGLIRNEESEAWNFVITPKNQSPDAVPIGGPPWMPPL